MLTDFCSHCVQDPMPVHVPNRLHQTELRHATTKDTDSSCEYDLLGVVDHVGSLEAGHFTATCQSPIDNCWYTCNDANVEQVSFNGTRSSKPYLLLYRKKD